MSLLKTKSASTTDIFLALWLDPFKCSPNLFFVFLEVPLEAELLLGAREIELDFFFITPASLSILLNIKDFILVVLSGSPLEA